MSLTIDYFLTDTVEAINKFFKDAIMDFQKWKSTKNPLALLDAFEGVALAWHHWEDFVEVAEKLPFETARKYAGLLKQTPEILREWYDIIGREAERLEAKCP